MPERTLEAKAELIRLAYEENPDLTIDQVSAAIAEPPEDIAYILDAFLVEDGRARLVGPGQGGGWTPQPEEETDGES